MALIPDPILLNTQIPSLFPPIPNPIPLLNCDLIPRLPDPIMIQDLISLHVAGRGYGFA